MKNPFISVNCGAISENLFESEFFGYEKGAFTGASSEGKKGLIEAAEGGTLFLDEIADLPKAMQVKLLKVLDSRTITRVGGLKEIPVDFRLIAATNKDIPSLIEKGEFREGSLHKQPHGSPQSFPSSIPAPQSFVFGQHDPMSHFL